mmetsp:Transcript_40809/g.100405  ORF Transcript_40809/g.100405 Transcript_40809/m.100405 type:complete len:219 (+) Transcript_40809:524-1180(+)
MPLTANGSTPNANALASDVSESGGAIASAANGSTTPRKTTTARPAKCAARRAREWRRSAMMPRYDEPPNGKHGAYMSTSSRTDGPNVVSSARVSQPSSHACRPSRVGNGRRLGLGRKPGRPTAPMPGSGILLRAPIVKWYKSGSQPCRPVYEWCAIVCWWSHMYTDECAEPTYAHTRFSHAHLESEKWLPSCSMAAGPKKYATDTTSSASQLPRSSDG